MNSTNGSNKMNYVLIVALCAIAAFAMVSSRLKSGIDSSAWAILTMIVGGFLTLLEPNNHKSTNDTSVQAELKSSDEDTSLLLRTPPSDGLGVTKDTTL